MSSILEERAAKDGDRRAFVFLSEGKAAGSSLSYSELDTKAKALAARLQATSQPGDRALILLQPGEGYVVTFLACLYAGLIAVPLMPAKPGRENARLSSVARDAEASLAVVQDEPAGANIVDLIGGALRTITLSGSDSLDAASFQLRPYDSPVAYLQYTSGSTSTPKGVVVTHANLLRNLDDLCGGWDHTPETRLLTWLPPFHDMGLIYGILAPIYRGFECYTMSPASFLQRPSRWIEAISTYKITHSIAPNAGYDMCTEKVDLAALGPVDLSSWKVAVNGSEPVRLDTMQRFARKFEQCGFDPTSFCPGYGLAEATLKVSAVRATECYRTLWVSASGLERGSVHITEAGAEGSRAFVGCGRPEGDTVVRIVDPVAKTACFEGVVGEIWVRGSTVASGYWRKHAATEETFGAVLDDGEGPFLRTGDLGFLHGGELYVSGRLKDVIVIAGRNHYPQDLEQTAQQISAGMRPSAGAAFSLTEDSDRVVLVQEFDVTKTEKSPDDLCEAVRARIAADHDITLHGIVLIAPRTLPKTSSGKIQRARARQLYKEGSLDVVASWSAPAIEACSKPAGVAEASPREWLLALFSGLIGIPASGLSTTEPLVSYGLTSLSALEACHAMETAFDVSIPLDVLFRDATIADLEARVKARLATTAEPSGGAQDVQPVSYEMTPGQAAMFFLESLLDVPGACNISCALRIEGHIDVRALRAAWEQLQERHLILRARFFTRGARYWYSESACPCGELRVDDWSTADISVMSAIDPSAIERWAGDEVNRPFNLAMSAVRLSALRVGASDWRLAIVIHHIAADLWSMNILIRELFELYGKCLDTSRPPLPSPRLQFPEAAECAKERLTGSSDILRSYWREELKGDLPLLDVSSSRTSVRSFSGGSTPVTVGRNLSDAVRRFASEHGTTAPIVLLAAYHVLLSKYTGQADVITGCPVVGRERASDANVVGYMVNTVPIRSCCSPHSSFTDYVAVIKDKVLDATRRQAYPFSAMVEDLQRAADLARSPIYQALFVFQAAPGPLGAALAAAAVGVPGSRLPVDGLVVETMAVPARTAQFELALNLAEYHGCFRGSITFQHSCFDAALAEQIARHYEALLAAVLDCPGRAVEDLDYLPAEDARRITTGLNETTKRYPLDRPLHFLIRDQVDRTPAGVAVIAGDKQVSYSELDELADALAGRLQELGVGRDDLVGVCMERSIGLVVALLACLKSGAAYVALDPAYPADRLLDMVEQARPRLVICEPAFAQWFERTTAVLLDKNCRDNPKRAAGFQPVATHPDGAAYVIFTSGSTGRPKGAVNTHAAIVNRLLWMQDAFSLSSSDRVLQKTPISFDVSVWEFFWPLMTGASIVMARPGGHKDPAYLAECIRRSRVTALHFVPAMLNSFLEHDSDLHDTSLRLVVCSGEALSPELRDRFHRSCSAELHNLYGPTEAAVDVTHWPCKPDPLQSSVPIGRPIANTAMYVLDAKLRPVPLGVRGELFIAGVGLARGYVAAPALTADRFLPCPFGSPGGRMYRTGDLARYRTDGALEYLGRLDDQVKIRGCRIEIGEIETALRRYPEVRDCAVVARALPQGTTLVAYAVAEVPPSSAELRLHLQRTLPDYMIPAGFVWLPELPHLPNGKVNRKMLPDWSPSTASNVEPASELERDLCRIWAEVLQAERVGPDDNFFELGGHSLLLAVVAAEVEARLGRTIPLAALFQAPTVRELAAALVREKLPNELEQRQASPNPPESARYTTSRRPDTTSEKRTLTVAIPTANRPAALVRCVESWLGNPTLRSTGATIVVVENSGAADSEHIVAARLRTLSAQSGVAIDYWGSMRLKSFAANLQENSGVSPDTIDFALNCEDVGLPRVGAARNAISLLCAGQRVLSVDDDTLSHIGVAPGTVPGVAVSDEPFPPSITSLEDREQVWTHLNGAADDALSLLDTVLGKSASELGIGATGDVRVASFGSAGDCGWGTPSNYLFVEEASFQTLVRNYERVCRSRTMIQATRQVTLSHRSEHLMTMFLGLDASTMLCPFLPMGRGEDALFGTTFAAQAGEAGLIAYLPWILPHVPLDDRRFSPGEVVRGASGMTLSRVIQLAIDDIDLKSCTGARERLREIGQQLKAVGELSPDELSSWLRGRATRHCERLRCILSPRLERYGAQYPLFAHDAERFLKVLDETAKSPSFGVPLDVLYGRPMQDALSRTGSIIVRFGKLLQAWPDLMHAATELNLQRARAARAAC